TVSGATGYQVWRNTVSLSSTATQIGSPAAPPFNDTTAAAGTAYYYWVKSTSSCGTSDFSASDIGFRNVAPAAPTGVAASDTACSAVNVTWNAVTFATGYQIWRNTANDSSTATQIGSAPASPFADTTAIVGTGYFYWVRATNACGTSPFSASDAGQRAC